MLAIFCSALVHCHGSHLYGCNMTLAASLSSQITYTWKVSLCARVAICIRAWPTRAHCCHSTPASSGTVVQRFSFAVHYDMAFNIRTATLTVSLHGIRRTNITHAEWLKWKSQRFVEQYHDDAAPMIMSAIGERRNRPGSTHPSHIPRTFLAVPQHTSFSRRNCLRSRF
jgi:hypothetical protein